MIKQAVYFPMLEKNKEEEEELYVYSLSICTEHCQQFPSCDFSLTSQFSPALIPSIHASVTSH